MQNYGGNITWIAYAPDEVTSAATTLAASEELSLEDIVTVESNKLGAMFDGSYGSESTDNYENVKSATFFDLVPGGIMSCWPWWS